MAKKTTTPTERPSKKPKPARRGKVAKPAPQPDPGPWLGKSHTQNLLTGGIS